MESIGSRFGYGCKKIIVGQGSNETRSAIISTELLKRDKKKPDTIIAVTQCLIFIGRSKSHVTYPVGFQLAN